MNCKQNLKLSTPIPHKTSVNKKNSGAAVEWCAHVLNHMSADECSWVWVELKNGHTTGSCPNFATTEKYMETGQPLPTQESSPNAEMAKNNRIVQRAPMSSHITPSSTRNVSFGSVANAARAARLPVRLPEACGPDWDRGLPATGKRSSKVRKRRC